MDIRLFPNERDLLKAETQNGNLWVTTCRLRHGYDQQFTSMLLEEVCSIRVAYHQKILFLIFGLLATMAGLVAASSVDNRWGILAGVGVILVIVFIVTRHHALEIASAGATIRIRTSGSKEDMNNLVETVERAKNDRYLNSTVSKSEAASS